MNDDQGYYSILPSSIIARPDLSPNAKLLYAVLSSLSRKDGFAWAGNAYLGECLGGVAERTVSRLVNELKKAGLVGCKGNETDPHRQIWLTDLAKNGVVTPPKMASNNTRDNTRDKEKIPLSEVEPPSGASVLGPVITSPRERIKSKSGEWVNIDPTCPPMVVYKGIGGFYARSLDDFDQVAQVMTDDDWAGLEAAGRRGVEISKPRLVAPDINVGTKEPIPFDLAKIAEGVKDARELFEEFKAHPVDLDPRGMAECSPMPAEMLDAGPMIDMSAEAAPAVAPPDPRKALEKALMAKFESIQPDGRFPSQNYAKEWKGVKRLVTEAIGRQPDNPEAWLGGYFAAWKRLQKDRKTLIHGQPDTPSKMAAGGFVDYVVAEMAQASLIPDSGEVIPW
jgi:hypothetical protein